MQRTLILLALTAATLGAQPLPRATLISGARILSPDGTRFIEGSCVLLRGGRIMAVAPRGELDVPASARHLDASGLHLVPGLIDLHSHLLLHPYDEASWNDQVLKERLELRVCRAVAAGRATLLAGFTTLRDLGTEGAGFADVALREAFRKKIVSGPRLFTVTRALVATGCYGPSGFDPRFRLPKGAQECDGVAGVRKAVREQVAAGADWIKVYADYRRRPGDPSTPTFSLPELESIVDEARSAGLPVAAHASTSEAIRRSVLAGVRTIEHGYGASAEVLAMMRQKDVALCPTLTASESMARYQGWKPGQPEPRRIQQSRAMFRRALEAGVTIANGSDVGVFRHGDNARELELMVAYGMAPGAALRAATVVAAAVLGQTGELGAIVPGAEADLLLVAGDPLKSPAALRGPALVMQAGKVVVDRRAHAARRELVGLCDRMLSHYSKKDFAAAATLFAPGAIVGMDHPARGRTRSLPAAEFLKQAERSLAGVSRFREWLTDEPVVHMDHHVAVVWAPFALEADGRRATGVNVFQLLRLEGSWKILSLTWTNRPF